MRRILIPVVLLALLVPSVAAKDKEAEEAWNALQKKFLKAMKSTDTALRIVVVKQVAAVGTPDAARLIAEKVFPKEASGRVLDAAVVGLARHATRAAVDTLLAEARSAKWRTHTLILEALAYRTDPSPAWDLFVEDAENEDPKVRSMALFGLGACKDRRGIPLLITGLEAEAWQVRVAAIEGLGALGGDEAIRALIGRLAKETGRLRSDIADALKAITGRDHGIDPDLWRSWLAAREDGKDGIRNDGQPKPAGGDGGEGASSDVEEPTYYGIKLVSENIVFIIDLSLSMMDPIEVDMRRLLRETRARTPREGEDEEKPKKREKGFEDRIKWYEIQNRLDLAKAQLVYALGQLDRRQKFDIVTFSESAEAWQGRLVEATPRTRARAANFVEGLEVDGATNAWAALDTAFGLAGKGKGRNRHYETGADTIFMISDGAPSVGDHVDPEVILAEIRSMNRTRKIKIHVVCIYNAQVPFLRELAKQNGGVFKFFKVGK